MLRPAPCARVEYRRHVSSDRKWAVRRAASVMVPGGERRRDTQITIPSLRPQARHAASKVGRTEIRPPDRLLFRVLGAPTKYRGSWAMVYYWLAAPPSVCADRVMRLLHVGDITESTSGSRRKAAPGPRPSGQIFV